MDPTELLKATPELKRIAEIIVGGIPAGEIVKAIVLPSASALGERMKNRVERLLEKTGKMVQDAGISPQPPADKLVIRIVRNAAMENDENLHDMWAALLANAASNMAKTVRPSFVSLLREMASDEAELLHAICDEAEAFTQRAAKDGITMSGRNKRFISRLHARFPKIAAENKAQENARFEACIQTLESTGLISLRTHGVYNLTGRGKTFLAACSPPKPKP